MSKEIYAEKISKAVNPTEDKPQLSDRTINEMLDTLIPLKVEDEADDAFVERILPIFKTAAGNVRNDVSQFSNAEKERLAKEYKKQNEQNGGGNNNEGGGNEGEGGSDTPEWVKALIESNREIMEWKKEQEAKQSTLATRESIIAKAKAVYPESVISVASLNFDFGKENAEEVFNTTLADAAKYMGVSPQSGEPDKEPNYSDFVDRQKKILGI